MPVSLENDNQRAAVLTRAVKLTDFSDFSAQREFASGTRGNVTLRGSFAVFETPDGQWIGFLFGGEFRLLSPLELLAEAAARPDVESEERSDNAQASGAT